MPYYNESNNATAGGGQNSNQHERATTMTTKTKETGSLCENGRLPKVGQAVWALVTIGRTIEEKPRRGYVMSVTNIDNRGLSNTYCDIGLASGKRVHVSISQIYGHKPKMVEIVDEYGPVSVWR